MKGRYIDPLDGSGALVADVGGKAAGLDALVGLSLPVPAAVALRVDAYRHSVSFAGLGETLADIRKSPIPRADALEAEQGRVESVFLEMRLPSDVESDIVAAAERLLSDGPIAVRSSALAEDLAGASFAGQYLTVLQVKTPSDAVAAVKRCWASLWSPAVRAYRSREGLAEIEPAMAVVLQAMVQAETAGVLFTRDPVGDSSHARVESVEGLGEALVSGAVTPDVFRVERESVESLDRGAPSFVGDLTRLGLGVEQRLGVAQDIEWAFADGRIFILQARPITVTAGNRADDDGFDSEPDQGHVYTSAGLQEMLPGVLAPLAWSVNAPMLDDAFRHLFADLGIEAITSPGRYLVVHRFRGRAALNLSVLRSAAASMSGGSAAEVDRQYLGRVLDDAGTAGSRSGLRGAISGGLRALKLRKRVVDEAKLVEDSTHLLLALNVDHGGLPAERLVAYWERIRDVAWRGYAAEVVASAGAAAGYRGLEAALEKWIGPDDAALWAQQITTGPVPEQAGARHATSLLDVYGGPGTRGRLADLVHDGGDPQSAVQRDPRLAEAVRLATRHLGSKAIFGGATWDEDTVAVAAWMKTVGSDNRTADPSPERRMEALERLMGVLRSSWRWRLARVVTGQIIDVRKRILERLADDAAELLALRERAKSALLILGGEEHRLVAEAARRLLASGHVVDAADIEFLTSHEVEDGLLGRDRVAPTEIQARKAAYLRAVAAPALPEHFSGLPGVVDARVDDATTLAGWAASPGSASGRARVIASIADAADLEPGDVFVARATDPSWTPLFLIAGAIVLEQGGPLSHAAIVAREFGLPAVLNVKGATLVIADGEVVTVDGTAGVVVRHQEEAV